MGSQVSWHADATAVMVALRRIVRVFRLADREAQGQHGLSAAQLYVLHMLAENPGSSLAEVAALTLTDQSSVSTVVSKLVTRKLVSRKKAEDDARRAELRLTAAGVKAVRKAPRLPQTLIADAVKAMTTKKRTDLVRSLDALIAAIGAQDLEPSMLFEDERGRS